MANFPNSFVNVTNCILVPLQQNKFNNKLLSKCNNLYLKKIIQLIVRAYSLSNSIKNKG